MGKRDAGQPIRVLIVEDSRAQRELLIGLLQASGFFNVIGAVANGKAGVEETLRLRPDIVTMDIHLPLLDGYEATRQIMQKCPTPIVMVSSSIGDAAQRALEAQTVGALAVVRKPGSKWDSEHVRDRDALIRTLRLMADVPVITRHTPRSRERGTGILRGKQPRQPKLLAVASSTGGPAAVQQLFNGLGRDFPLPVVLAQHISRGFVEALVEWLNNTTTMTIKIAHAGEYMLPGHVYLPPDDQHILIRERNIIALRPMSEPDRYCPSANYLFDSVADSYGAQAVGVIMTGMGNDGAEGLRKMHTNGAITFAQDEASCVVYGMPQAAVALNAVTRVEPLDRLAQAIVQQMRQLEGR